MKKTPHKPLKENLIDHYQSQSLNPDQLAQLQSSIASESKTEKLPLWISESMNSFKLAFACASLFIISLSLYSLYDATKKTQIHARIDSKMNLKLSSELNLKIKQKISQEVAINHFKNYDPKFKATQISELQAQMPLLNFKLLESEKLNSQKYKLLGSRYCSIQGQRAAQMKLIDKKTNSTYTLYQAALTPLTKNITSSTELYSETALGSILKNHKNLQIKIWKESKNLFVLAGPSEMN